MDKKLLILVLICLSFVAVAVGLIASKEMTIRTGTTILLETMPVDPRDLLRGDYVVLNYSISVINTSVLPGQHSYKQGQTVYVGLENDGRYWKVVSLSSAKPGQGIFIRGKVRSFYSSRLNVVYGLESYFVPEGEGSSIERVMRGSNSSIAVEAVVDAQGNAVIKRLITVEGQPRRIDSRREWHHRVRNVTPQQPVVRTPEPVIKATELCGNGVCDKGEDYISCSQDCAEVIYPFASDVASCRDSTGKVWPATGQGAATWFNWNGCSREKSYEVKPGQEIILHAYSDACDSCVCNYPNFCILELRNGSWEQTQCFNFGTEPGRAKYQPYTPASDRIKITADRCFYLEVLRKK
jgi:uncharacterized membrane-anchored protein